ncbi:MAG: hypothetical protein B6I34_08965 [Anaerolineaceae bacterium 4572_32.1]|nr:MAG: hypothetical protein B6I34_08965 [Anaerolineaceae bacterium 4572_32.1]
MRKCATVRFPTISYYLVYVLDLSFFELDAVLQWSGAGSIRPGRRNRHTRLVVGATEFRTGSAPSTVWV